MRAQASTASPPCSCPSRSAGPVVRPGQPVSAAALSQGPPSSSSTPSWAAITSRPSSSVGARPSARSHLGGFPTWQGGAQQHTAPASRSTATGLPTDTSTRSYSAAWQGRRREYRGLARDPCGVDGGVWGRAVLGLLAWLARALPLLAGRRRARLLSGAAPSSLWPATTTGPLDPAGPSSSSDSPASRARPVPSPCTHASVSSAETSPSKSLVGSARLPLKGVLGASGRCSPRARPASSPLVCSRASSRLAPSPCLPSWPGPAG